MRRRSFLISAAALTAGAVLGDMSKVSRAETPTSGPGAAAPDGKITEPAREIPIIASADVVVVGGGPAGVVAAVAAARGGASVILVERYNHLGGLWTGGLVLPLLSTHGFDREGKVQQVLFGIGGEIAQQLVTMKMAPSMHSPTVDPEATKYVLEETAREAGIRVLYHCWAAGVIAKDGVIQAVLIECKSGRVALVPKVVVDCTGDGDVFAWAGEQFTQVRLGIGLNHRLGNMDRIDKSKPKPKQDLGGGTPIKSVNWVNMVGQSQDALDIFTLSRLQQKHRLDIWKRVEGIRATPGYEDVFLLDTASQLGVRASRILDGQYQLTLEESLSHKAFDDAIGVGGSWTDVSLGTTKIKSRPMWQIPYRCLVPKKTRNLLVAGRCICHEKRLVENVRVIGTCMITGQGAGAAAAVVAKSGTTVQDADVVAIRKMLTDQKAFLG